MITYSRVTRGNLWRRQSFKRQLGVHGIQAMGFFVSRLGLKIPKPNFAIFYLCDFRLS